ncbi:MAG: Vps62-related protein [Chloroflexota bacterium]
MSSLQVRDRNNNPALEIAFASQYQLAWGDWGSGADTDFSGWKATPPAGFLRLGDYAKTGYDSPQTPMLVVRAIQPNALAYPTGYNQIWNDRKSGADSDGSFWEPIPPAGYKALGCVIVNNHSQPALDQIVCVREDLVTLGVVGSRIWGDWGSGAASDVTLWQIVPTSPPVDSKLSYITSGSFCGHNSYADMLSSNVAYALAVQLPIDSNNPPTTSPVLTGTREPDPKTPPQLDAVSYLPCIMVQDDAYRNRLQAQVTDTPFYKLEKYVFYKLQSFDTNSGEGGEVSFSATVGMSTTEQTTVTNTIGISMTAGYSSPNTTGGPSFSVTVSYSFALSESFSTTLMQSQTRTRTYPIPKDGAGALYSRTYEYQLKRADGTIIKTWQLATDSMHFAVYPHNGS